MIVCNSENGTNSYPKFDLETSKYMFKYYSSCRQVTQWLDVSMLMTVSVHDWSSDLDWCFEPQPFHAGYIRQKSPLCWKCKCPSRWTSSALRKQIIYLFDWDFWLTASFILWQHKRLGFPSSPAVSIENVDKPSGRQLNAIHEWEKWEKDEKKQLFKWKLKKYWMKHHSGAGIQWHSISCVISFSLLFCPCAFHSNSFFF